MTDEERVRHSIEHTLPAYRELFGRLGSETAVNDEAVEGALDDVVRRYRGALDRLGDR